MGAWEKLKYFNTRGHSGQQQHYRKGLKKKFEYNQQRVKVSWLKETGKNDYPLIYKSVIQNGKNIKSEQ